ncbi:MAG: hypothetical protein ACTSX6_00255 [Candidatus Heimdallarchaeaceae archaeon]
MGEKKRVERTLIGRERGESLEAYVSRLKGNIDEIVSYLGNLHGDGLYPFSDETIRSKLGEVTVKSGKTIEIKDYLAFIDGYVVSSVNIERWEEPDKGPTKGPNRRPFVEPAHTYEVEGTGTIYIGLEPDISIYGKREHVDARVVESTEPLGEGYVLLAKVECDATSISKIIDLRKWLLDVDVMNNSIKTELENKNREINQLSQKINELESKIENLGKVAEAYPTAVLWSNWAKTAMTLSEFMRRQVYSLTNTASYLLNKLSEIDADLSSDWKMARLPEIDYPYVGSGVKVADPVRQVYEPVSVTSTLGYWPWYKYWYLDLGETKSIEAISVKNLTSDWFYVYGVYARTANNGSKTETYDDYVCYSWNTYEFGNWRIWIGSFYYDYFYFTIYHKDVITGEWYQVDYKEVWNYPPDYTYEKTIGNDYLKISDIKFVQEYEGTMDITATYVDETWTKLSDYIGLEPYGEKQIVLSQPVNSDLVVFRTPGWATEESAEYKVLGPIIYTPTSFTVVTVGTSMPSGITQVILSAIDYGTVNYSVSFDDGATWTDVQKDQLTDITSTVPENPILRVKMNGTTQDAAVGWVIVGVK